MIDCPRTEQPGVYRLPTLTNPMNFQDELNQIHELYGISPTANRKIEKLFVLFAQEYHESELHKMAVKEQQAERILHIYNMDKTNIPEGPNGPVVIFHKSKL